LLNLKWKFPIDLLDSMSPALPRSEALQHREKSSGFAARRSRSEQRVNELLQVSEKVFQPAGLHVAQSADEGEKAANRKRGNNPAPIAPINSHCPALRA
jgi:hypothetical protein